MQDYPELSLSIQNKTAGGKLDLLDTVDQSCSDMHLALNQNITEIIWSDYYQTYKRKIDLVQKFSDLNGLELSRRLNISNDYYI